MKHLLLLLLLALPAVARAANNEEVLSFDGAIEEEGNFAVLARKYRQGTAENRPWAGYWFDYKSDGIARKNPGDPLTTTQKYDLLMRRKGRRSSHQWELENHGRQLEGVEDWWGHCNGWTGAALLEREPRRSRTIEGIRFTVADQKALLSETHMEVSTDFLGYRFDGGSMRSSEYKDVTPAQFHLVLVNLLGRQRQGFAVDRHTHDEVWNQPVIAYQMKTVRPEDYLGATRAAPGVYRINVEMTFWMVNDSVPAEFVTPEFHHQNDEIFFKRTLNYELWLDAPVEFSRSGAVVKSGNIILEEDPETGEMIGGKWHNGKLPKGDRHPDFMWLPYEITPPTDYGNPHVDATAVAKIIRGISPHDRSRDEDWMEE